MDASEEGESALENEWLSGSDANEDGIARL